MSKEPLVSVITPAYNAEKYIAKTIESILSQTYKNFEYIIVDDASTDSTWDIIQEYANKDSRIKAFKNENNLYIAGNRNKGLDKASGKYIVWQDADDISLPIRIEIQVKFMENNPQVGICGAFLQSFEGDKDMDIRKYPLDDKTLRKNIFRYSPVAQPAAIIRKKTLDEVGKYDLSTPPAEDIDMSFRIGKNYKFANIPEVLIRYREHPDSATFKKLRTQIKSTLKTRRKYAGDGYEMSLVDHLAFVATWFVQFFPPKFVTFVFKVAKNIVSIFSREDK